MNKPRSRRQRRRPNVKYIQHQKRSVIFYNFPSRKISTSPLTLTQLITMICPFLAHLTQLLFSADLKYFILGMKCEASKKF